MDLGKIQEAEKDGILKTQPVLYTATEYCNLKGYDGMTLHVLNKKNNSSMVKKSVDDWYTDLQNFKLID